LPARLIEWREEAPPLSHGENVRLARALPTTVALIEEELAGVARALAEQQLRVVRERLRPLVAVQQRVMAVAEAAVAPELLRAKIFKNVEAAAAEISREGRMRLDALQGNRLPGTRTTEGRHDGEWRRRVSSALGHDSIRGFRTRAQADACAEAFVIETAGALDRMVVGGAARLTETLNEISSSLAAEYSSLAELPSLDGLVGDRAEGVWRERAVRPPAPLRPVGPARHAVRGALRESASAAVRGDDRDPAARHAPDSPASQSLPSSLRPALRVLQAVRPFIVDKAVVCQGVSARWEELRRLFTEHLSSSADFYWRHEIGPCLAARDEALRHYTATVRAARGGIEAEMEALDRARLAVSDAAGELRRIRREAGNYQRVPAGGFAPVFRWCLAEAATVVSEGITLGRLPFDAANRRLIRDLVQFASGGPELCLPVVAPTGSGKSTLVNAVLGEELLPAGNLTTTLLSTRIVLVPRPDQPEPELFLPPRLHRSLRDAVSALRPDLVDAAARRIVRDNPHLTAMAARITSGELTFETDEYRGTSGVRDALADLNDLLRLRMLLDEATGKDPGPGADAFEAPTMLVGIDHSELTEDGVRLVLVDTPGSRPDVSDVSNVSSPLHQILRRHLTHADGAVMIFDFTRLGRGCEAAAVGALRDGVTRGDPRRRPVRRRQQGRSAPGWRCRRGGGASTGPELPRLRRWSVRRTHRRNHGAPRARGGAVPCGPPGRRP
jgi:hypothetical protein